MKNRYIFTILAVLPAIFSCQIMDESELTDKEEVAKVDMIFTASIENGIDSKASLSGELGDGPRKVLWEPKDRIGVIGRGMTAHLVEKFTLMETEATDNGNFSGSIAFCQSYHAFYPYNSLEEYEAYTNDSYCFKFYLPTFQTYTQGSFDPLAAPMVASGNYGETLQFKNLCGVLALRLTGEEAVRSVSFTGYDESGNPIPVSGKYYALDIDTDEPRIEVAPFEMPQYSITLLSMTDAVVLDPETPTPFYFVLPPGTYNSFTIIVTTDDGKKMYKEGRKPLTIKRSDVQPTSALTYVEDVYIDLSCDNKSNCYIVSNAGLYTFDASVIGNGDFGMMDGYGYHTSSTSITPVTADIIWQDNTDVVMDVHLDGNMIKFSSIGRKGNALLAAKDESGKILWSWHIWATDQPQEQTYENYKGSFTMLDRNIGATRADRGTGEQWRDGAGLPFQWGRKDPFAYGNYTNVNTQFTVAESIQNPTTFAHGNSQWAKNWSSEFWNEDKKTIYDPCPAGYRVPVMDVWAGFTLNGENADRLDNINFTGQTFDKGWYFYRNNNESTWYPVTKRIDYWGSHYTHEEEGYLWSANNEGYSSYYFGWRYISEYECYVRVKDHSENPVYAYSVRCMKDELANHVAVRLNNATDVTSTTAHASASVSVQGSIEVQSAGFIYGTNPNLSLTSGTVLNSAAQDGVITYDITGLESLTKYYIKAFAIASNGQEYYSDKTYSFITPNESGIVDLSVNGSANCYVVLPVKGKYTFDLVKGNSSTSVGNATDMVVLWETWNNTNSVTTGSVIESADIENGKAVFEIPADAVSGNALIAAKDASGTILWSWHIWVADFDPEASAQTYISGAVMMDRNLGAIDIMPGTVESYGFYYQWGRKDPFVINGYMNTAPSDAISYEYYDPNDDTIEKAVKNPCVVYNDAQWGYNYNLWNSEKTIYDPCPSGWRVSDSYAWEGISRAENAQYGYIQLSPESANPTAFLPAAGRTDGDSNVSEINDDARLWNTTRGHNLYFYTHSSNPNISTSYGADNLMSVRCMKIDTSGKPGNGDDYIVDDEYEWD